MHYTELKNTFTGRCIAFLIVVYLIIVPVQRAKAEVTSTTLTLGMAAAAATALGSSAYVPSGLAAAAAPAGAAAVAIGTFALAFCTTSYVMQTNLCGSDSAETGGQIGAAIINPSSNNNVRYYYSTNFDGYRSERFTSIYDACMRSQQLLKVFTGSNKILLSIDNDRLICHFDGVDATIIRYDNALYDPAINPYNSPEKSGNNILKSAVATAAMAAAATSLARGATYQAAVDAARAAASAVNGKASSNNAGVDAAIAAYQAAKSAGKSDAEALAAATAAGGLAGLTAAQVNAAVSAYKSSYTSAASVNAAASAFQSQLMSTTLSSGQINSAVSAYKNALTQGKSQADAYKDAMASLQNAGVDTSGYNAAKMTDQASKIQNSTARVDAQASLQSTPSDQAVSGVNALIQVHNNAVNSGSSAESAQKAALAAGQQSGLSFEESVAALRAYVDQVNTVTSTITQQKAALNAVADTQANNTRPQAAVIGGEVGAAVADKETSSADYKAGAAISKPELTNPDAPAGPVPNNAIGGGTAAEVKDTAKDKATEKTDTIAKEGGGGSSGSIDKSIPFELPSFCGWAKTVCDFAEWTKTQYADAKNKVSEWATDDTVTEEAPAKVEEETDTQFQNQMQSVNFGGNAQCPQDINVPVNFAGLGQSSLKISYAPLCTMADKMRPVVIMLAWILGAYIVTGRNMKESEA